MSARVLFVLGCMCTIVSAHEPVKKRFIYNGGGDGAAECITDTGTTVLPPLFIDTPYLDGWNQGVGLAFDGIGRMYVWERTGYIWTVENGVKSSEPLLDIHDEVNSTGDRGLLGVALDPDFLNNGYIYLVYVVDRHHVDHFGTPEYDPEVDEYYVNTIGRVTRYTVDIATFNTLVPDSRLILLGEDLYSGFPICTASHGIGTIVFGNDGSLLMACGDAHGSQLGELSCHEEGMWSDAANVKELRSQLLDTLNGKLVRIDPMTGDGLPDNPFYDSADPRSARSRIWALGLRNPFRFSVRESDDTSHPGTVYVGDVGGGSWEELTIIKEAGTNAGWPAFEGLLPKPNFWNSTSSNLDASNPLFGQDVPGVGVCTQEFFDFQDLFVEETLNTPSWPNPCDPSQQINVPVFMHTRPQLAWSHYVHPAVVPDFDGDGNAIEVALGDPASPVAGPQFAGNCAVGGVYYNGLSFPAEYQSCYFHADYGAGWIMAAQVDENDDVVAVKEFASSAGAVVALTVHPFTGDLYYMALSAGGASIIRRIRYEPGNQPPIALAQTDVSYGPTPFTVQFDATASSDGDDDPLSYFWDFGPNQPRSVVQDPVRTYPLEDITDQGTIISLKQELLETHGPSDLGSPGSSDPEVIRDGLYADLGVTDFDLQYDTLYVQQVGATYVPLLKFDFDTLLLEDWLGYTFPQQRTFRALSLQEGVVNFAGSGGFFLELSVQVRNGAGEWEDVSNLQIAPAYQGQDNPDYGTYELHFDAAVGDGIRLYGWPGGLMGYISVGELRAYADPLTPQPIVAYDAQLTVTDIAGNSDCDTITVYPDNTPPLVEIDYPVHGDAYDGDKETITPLVATISDVEFPDEQLACSWQITLHHDNHIHPEVPLLDCDEQTTLVPHATDPGDVLYYEITLIVSDPTGLSHSASHYLYPDNDCNFNGITDLDDIVAGTSLDVNLDRVPDECAEDCNRNGIHDLFEIVLKDLTDLNNDGLADECYGPKVRPKLPKIDLDGVKVKPGVAVSYPPN